MNSLETAGYLYNPFTEGDIWGQPSQFMNTETHAQELQVGQDDSALPELANPALQQDLHQGSARPEFRKRTRRELQQESSNVALLGFIALLAAAFYWQQ